MILFVDVGEVVERAEVVVDEDTPLVEVRRWQASLLVEHAEPAPVMGAPEQPQDGCMRCGGLVIERKYMVLHDMILEREYKHHCY